MYNTPMNKDDLKAKLAEERDLLESELSRVGRPTPGVPGDWEPTQGDMDAQKSEKNEMAKVMESFEQRTAVEVELENRLVRVKKALEKIDTDEYGVCEVGGERIEEARLEANPAATTCMKHMNG